MIRHPRSFAMCALALALAGCGDKPEKTESGPAQGEVLGGTISDHMLPLDTVSSTPPALQESAEPSAANTAAPGANDPDEEIEPAATDSGDTPQDSG